MPSVKEILGSIGGKKGKKGGKKGRKYGRIAKRSHAQARYRAERHDVINAVRRIRRHMNTHPTDLQAAANLTRAETAANIGAR